MSEPPYEEHRPTPGRMFAAEIRGSALGLLIAGGVCLYFGFALVIDAPGSAGEEATQAWYAADHAFRWCLRVLGALFLLAAAWAATGQCAAMLLSTAAEVAFALLMLAMSIEATLEARADGLWDFFVILLLILAVIGISAAKRSWSLYRMSGRAARTVPSEDS